MEVDGKKIDVLNVKLKSTKTSKAGSRGEVVQIFANGTNFCAVREMKKYLDANKKAARAKPLFREENGWALSLRKFNEEIRSVLEDKIDYGPVTAHSFRQVIKCPGQGRGSFLEYRQNHDRVAGTSHLDGPERGDGSRNQGSWPMEQ